MADGEIHTVRHSTGWANKLKDTYSRSRDSKRSRG